MSVVRNLLDKVSTHKDRIVSEVRSQKDKVLSDSHVKRVTGEARVVAHEIRVQKAKISANLRYRKIADRVNYIAKADHEDHPLARGLIGVYAQSSGSPYPSGSMSSKNTEHYHPDEAYRRSSETRSRHGDIAHVSKTGFVGESGQTSFDWNIGSGVQSLLSSHRQRPALRRARSSRQSRGSRWRSRQ